MHRFFLLALIVLGAPALVLADDWPQWLGPQRDGVWREKGLIEQFLKGGPKIVWRKPVSDGYSGPAVADGKVFITDRLRAKGVEDPKSPFDVGKLLGIERVHCFDAKTGDVLWTREYDCPYEVSYAAGPRTTPIVSGDKVYTLGTMGDLYCWNIKDGSVVWSKNLAKAYDIPTPKWGFAGHPLIDGNRLICLVGGQGSVAVAFDKDNGKELWKNLSAKQPGYAPPMIYTFGGKRQLILWHAQAVNGLDPETGKLYWTQPWGSESDGGGVKEVGAGMSIPTPRKLGEQLYLSCFYNGSLMIKLDGQGDRPTVLWQRKAKVVDPLPNRTEQLHCVMSTPAIRDGCIYGVCSYGEMRCLDAKTGQRKWESLEATGGKTERWGNAFIVQLGEGSDRYILFNEHGDLIVARLTPQKYEEISRAHILEPTNTMAGRRVVWSHPAFANRCVFARNDREIVCVSMANNQ
jgi:outer membrane protein assembly factor BamB